MNARLICAMALASGAALSTIGGAQGEIAGRVVRDDSLRTAVAGAQAMIASLSRAAASDSTGRFRFLGVPPGDYLVVVRAIGFRVESTTVSLDVDEVVSRDFVLRPSEGTVLPARVVTAESRPVSAKMVSFMDRMKAGTGHFVTREQLARAEGGLRQTGDVISTIPGVSVRRGSNKVWVATRRSVQTGKCAFCAGSVNSLNQADVAAGARPACFVDVYVDGAMVFDSRHPENGLFDINSIPPEHIDGIEMYTSAARIPAQYNRTGSGCGVLLVWTR